MSTHRLFHSSATNSTQRLTHLDDSGRANMVDVSDKSVTKRSATAVGRVQIPRVAYDLITSNYNAENGTPGGYSNATSAKAQKSLRKGDALTVAQLAGIMGAKRTSDLIPLCHPLALSKIDVSLTPEAEEGPQGISRYSILCRATVTCEGKTGVEMEALTAVSVGLLTVWDMLKAVAGKEMLITDIFVVNKSGGKSGDFQRSE